MGNNCPSCSQCNNVDNYPFKKPIKINDDEYKSTLLNIENEEKELLKS